MPPCAVHRLWVVVTSVKPLRVYLFNGGFLVFGAQRPEPSPSSPNQTAEVTWMIYRYIDPLELHECIVSCELPQGSHKLSHKELRRDPSPVHSAGFILAEVLLLCTKDWSHGPW